MSRKNLRIGGVSLQDSIFGPPNSSFARRCFGIRWTLILQEDDQTNLRQPCFGRPVLKQWIYSGDIYIHTYIYICIASRVHIHVYIYICLQLLTSYKCKYDQIRKEPLEVFTMWHSFVVTEKHRLRTWLPDRARRSPETGSFTNVVTPGMRSTKPWRSAWGTLGLQAGCCPVIGVYNTHYRYIRDI